MRLDLKALEEITIGENLFIVQPDPDPYMSHRPYIELGGNSFVVQLLSPKSNTYYALKIFNNPNSIVEENTLNLYKNKVYQFPGLKVANRSVINPKQRMYFDLLRRYPFLEYSILMPWIGGYTWFEILADEKEDSRIPKFNKKISVYYASQLAKILASLESRGVAHCDLCSNNIILDFKSTSVELIDIENMLLPNAKKNNDFIGGQDGYIHPNRILGHQWVNLSDRFGGGILLCEILTWCDPIIRKVSDSESFATQRELSKDLEKYHLMKESVTQQGNRELANLFERLWNSKSLDDCPTLMEWAEQINLVARYEIESTPTIGHLSQFGADGRIRIGRTLVSLDKTEKVSNSDPRKRTEISSPESSAPPSFQPPNPISNLLHPAPPIVVSNIAIGLDGKKIKVSVSYPVFLSKRFESIFLCQIYQGENRSKVHKNIKVEFQGEKFKEINQISNIKFGQKITTKFSSQNFSFSEPITKTIDDPIVKIYFLGKPSDNCEPGFHKIKVAFLDAETGEELDYLTIKNAKVVDFAFDHISRPLLSKVSTFFLGIGSFTIFILTLLEQIDKTVGLTSGTAIGVLAVAIYTNFYNLYQRIRPNIP